MTSEGCRVRRRRGSGGRAVAVATGAPLGGVADAPRVDQPGVEAAKCLFAPGASAGSWRRVCVVDIEPRLGAAAARIGRSGENPSMARAMLHEIAAVSILEFDMTGQGLREVRLASAVEPADERDMLLMIEAALSPSLRRCSPGTTGSPASGRCRWVRCCARSTVACVERGIGSAAGSRSSRRGGGRRRCPWALSLLRT